MAADGTLLLRGEGRMIATAPTYTTSDGGAVYLDELPPLRDIVFVTAIMYDAHGNEVTRFPSIPEKQLELIANSLRWEKVA